MLIKLTVTDNIAVDRTIDVAIQSKHIVCWRAMGEKTEIALGDGFYSLTVDQEVKEVASLADLTTAELHTAEGSIFVVCEKVLAISPHHEEGYVRLAAGSSGGFPIIVTGSLAEVTTCLNGGVRLWR